MRVLVIDDEEAVSELLRTLVSSLGHEPVVVRCAELGLAALEAPGVDVVVCDVVMPEMDGLAFLSEVGRRDPDVPVVLTTAHVDTKNLTRALRLNAFDVLEKPFDVATFEAALTRAICHREVLLQRHRISGLSQRVEALVRELNASPDLTGLYKTLDQQTLSALEADAFAVYRRLGSVIERQAGVGRAAWPENEWPMQIRRCLDEGELTEYSSESACFEFGVSSGIGLCLPLQMEMQRWGLLLVFRKEAPVDEIDRRYFRLLADHLSSLIAVRERSAELERALRALEETQGRLLRTEKLASVTKLVAGLAHEIKNPLTSMQFAVANARDELRDLVPAEQNAASMDQYLDVLAKDIDRLRERVDRFMQLARPDSAPRMHVDVVQLVRQVVDSTLPLADAREISLALEAPDAVPPIEVDPIAFEDALLNLVLNSVEAIDRNGAVIVRVAAAVHAVVVSVEDDGPGLDVEARERMFDIFYTTKAKGAGLGLSQVHVFVETHGGDIQWNSSEGKTRFDLLLPRRVGDRLERP